MILLLLYLIMNHIYVYIVHAYAYVFDQFCLNIAEKIAFWMIKIKFSYLNYTEVMFRL